MHTRKLNGTWLLLFFMFLTSCAVSQPSGDTDTKNKKAREAFNQALYYYNIRETANALESIETALKKDATYIDALLLKADILKTLKRFEESQQAYDAIIVQDKKLPEV